MEERGTSSWDSLSVKKMVMPSPNKFSPYALDATRDRNRAADAELDSGDPLVAVKSSVVPAVALLALAIGRQADKVLLDGAVSGAQPSLQLSVPYVVTGSAQRIPDQVKELKGGDRE